MGEAFGAQKMPAWGGSPAGDLSGCEKTNEEFWRAFEASEAAAHLLTEEGRIIAANPAFERMIGLPGLQVVGKHQASLNNKSVTANLSLLGEIRGRIAAEGCWRGRLEYCRPDGVAFQTRAAIIPINLGGRRLLVCLEENPGQAERVGGGWGAWGFLRQRRGIQENRP